MYIYAYIDNQSYILNTLKLDQMMTIDAVNQACNENEKVERNTNSEEDDSSTEWNNCVRFSDKPPLVKRLTMGFLKAHEESRPLVNLDTPTGEVKTEVNSMSRDTEISIDLQIYSNGYVNEDNFGPDNFISSKFGDSCRQSLTAFPALDIPNVNDSSEYKLKNKHLRETSSANSSPKPFVNRLKATHTKYNQTSASSEKTQCWSSEREEVELKDAPWFQAGISREIAEEVLASKSPGAFFVRRSASKFGCYALTLRISSLVEPKTANYIILNTVNGYKIKGFRKEFKTLKALITHHSVMPELLPVPLALPRPPNLSSSRRNMDDFDTYESLKMFFQYIEANNRMDTE
uniref:SH2 domain-containing protein n=1 Tax=Glossina brevipalpis TaxID=37001 RepID=A0A1A9X0N5_9MUSC